MKPILAATILLFFTHQLFSQTKSTENLRTLIDQYARSIDNADTILASRLFAHVQEVSFIQPRGHQRGWSEIRSQIYAFFGEQFSKRDLKISNEHINIYGNVAWAEFYWTFNATFKKGGEPLQTKGRETQIWRKTNGNWRLVHVHYSNMPTLTEGGGF
jgi:ketosteroid isomerase-like protein